MASLRWLSQAIARKVLRPHGGASLAPQAAKRFSRTIQGVAPAKSALTIHAVASQILSGSNYARGFQGCEQVGVWSEIA